MVNEPDKPQVAPFEGFVLGSNLVPLIDVWQPVADILNVTPKQAADFIETTFRALHLVLYLDDELSGLWKPVGLSLLGNDNSVQFMVDVWNAAESSGWQRTSLDEWAFLRMSRDSRAAILRAAERVRDFKPNMPDHGGPAISPVPNHWPWGSHTTTLLETFRGAAIEFWRLYDPEDPSTAPTNDQVVAWLTDRKVSQRVAEVMATILRADDLPSGPRK